MADGLLPSVQAHSPDVPTTISITNPHPPASPPASMHKALETHPPVNSASMHKVGGTHTLVPTPAESPVPTPAGLQTPAGPTHVTPDAHPPPLASTPLMHETTKAKGPAATSPSVAPTPTSTLRPTQAASSPFAAPTPAPHPQPGVNVILVRQGVVVISANWSPDTLLGSLISAWADQCNIPIARICLLHAQDDDYLADDVWWDDVGSLAKRWGDGFVIELRVPSQDQVPAPLHLADTPNLVPNPICECSCCLCLW